MPINDLPATGIEGQGIVYKKILSSQSTLAISKLNGNKDEFYKIEIEGSISITAAPSIVTNLSASWGGSGFVWNGTPSTSVVSGDVSGHPKLGDGFYGSGNTNNVSIEVSLTVAKGRIRKFRSDCLIWNANYFGRAIMGGMHVNDTTTNVTSLTINFGGPFTGVVKISKSVNN